MMKRRNHPRIRVRRERKTNSDGEKKSTMKRVKRGRKTNCDEEKKATEDKSEED